MQKPLYFSFFPRKCLSCGKLIDYKAYYCDSCRAQMPFIGEERCEQCGCGREHCRCKHKSTHYEAVLAPFYYEGGAKRAVIKLKRYPIYAEPLAKECAAVFAQYYGSIPFNFVCPVPMGKKRRRQSGFNHSAALAKEIAAQVGLPVQECLTVVGNAKAQHTLDFCFRAGNVRGIYDIIEDNAVSGKVILLVDDIKTSGATLNECALMLKLGGAKAVYALCVSVAKGQE